MKIMLLGFTVPDDVVQEIDRSDVRLATQTHRFAWGVVNGLLSAGVEVELLSAAPVSDYPKNPRLLFRGGSFQQAGVKGRYIPFVNVLALKHVTRWFNVWRLGPRRLLAFNTDWLLVHGVHTPFLWFAALVGRRAKVRVGVFLSDPPGVVLLSDSPLRRRLKNLDVYLTKKALRRMEAVIVLAEPLGHDYAPGVPSLTMEGLYDSERWGNISPEAHTSGSKVVTYAGGVSEEYGVGMLVRAVLDSTDPDIDLRIYGRGPLESWISDVAKVDRRVHPVSLADPAELPRIYAESSVLVQPRPVDQSFVRYSFPSKLLEYMASGVPVVTTRLPSIPDDYETHVVWAEDTELGLMESIERVLGWSAEERASLGSSASTFIRKTRSTTAQGKRIRGFLEEAG